MRLLAIFAVCLLSWGCAERDPPGTVRVAFAFDVASLRVERNHHYRASWFADDGASWGGFDLGHVSGSGNDAVAGVVVIVAVVVVVVVVAVAVKAADAAYHSVESDARGTTYTLVVDREDGTRAIPLQPGANLLPLSVTDIAAINGDRKLAIYASGKFIGARTFHGTVASDRLVLRAPAPVE